MRVIEDDVKVGGIKNLKHIVNGGSHQQSEVPRRCLDNCEE